MKSLDKFLIRNMAERFYYIDDPQDVLRLIMMKMNNRVNPKETLEIIEGVKRLEK